MVEHTSQFSLEAMQMPAYEDSPAMERWKLMTRLQELRPQLIKLTEEVQHCESRCTELSSMARSKDCTCTRFRIATESTEAVDQHWQISDSDGHDELDRSSVSSSSMSLQDQHADFDWEQLDRFGVGTCSLCCQKLPLDVDSIDKHLEECWQRSFAIPEVGVARCKDCFESIPQCVEAIDKHVCASRKEPVANPCKGGWRWGSTARAAKAR